MTEAILDLITRNEQKYIDELREILNTPSISAQNVGIGESRLMASKLRGAGKPVTFVEYKGLTHQLDDSDVRTDMLGKSDAFLRTALHIGG